MKRRINPALYLLLLVALVSACEPSKTNHIVGQLESDRIELTADFAEPIIDRLVREGDIVTAGQLLLRQDDARIVARMAEAAALIEQGRARLDELTRGPREEQIQAERASVAGQNGISNFVRLNTNVRSRCTNENSRHPILSTAPRQRWMLHTQHWTCMKLVSKNFLLVQRSRNCDKLKVSSSRLKHDFPYWKSSRVVIKSWPR